MCVIIKKTSKILNFVMVLIAPITGPIQFHLSDIVYNIIFQPYLGVCLAVFQHFKFFRWNQYDHCKFLEKFFLIEKLMLFRVAVKIRVKSINLINNIEYNKKKYSITSKTCYQDIETNRYFDVSLV